ncbi:FtsX-like permease family protein [Glycomyces sp. TRM65418]|uniref:ABC transporter permease n=1 Tax=Glycomyces sp. TRM65418 TaxID=2867006 RepID=UPI001CE517F2|nr:FtsX-like permease family protein [Glycomyces sp. TRM65418]MCC3763570.1 FtsX-like permease family protein [Glycomyces sp. TRM65418]QZD57554.1 FtsX-like permease family protein [Glycomyces sp. TRM65418]
MAAPTLHMARRRLAGLVAVGFAVAGGAAMITVAAILAETGLTSHIGPERLEAAEVLVAATQSHPVPEDVDPPLPERVPIDADLVDTVTAVPGVEAAAADVAFTARIDEPFTAGAVAGHSWDTAALTGAEVDGRAPAGPDEIVLGDATAHAAGLAVGDTAEVTTPTGTGVFTVVGLTDAPGLHTDAATAQGLAGLDAHEADVIAVRTEPGADVDAVADALRETLPGLEVAVGDARGDVERLGDATASADLIALAIAMAGTIVLLVGFITAGALAVAVANQRRDLALLRAVGATPRQVRRLVAAQASAAAAIALIPGIAAGHLLAGGFTGFLTDSGMLPAGLPLARTPISAAIVASLLLLTVQLAARGAAMRASRLPATAAVAEARVEPKAPGRVRTVIGFVLLVMAGAQALLPLVTPGETAFIAAVTATIVAVIGFALAGPVLVGALTRRAARRLDDRTPAPKWLAVQNSRAFARRTAGAVAVLALAVGLTITQVFSQTTYTEVTAAEIEDGATADATVTGPVGAADLAELRDRPGVDAAVGVAPTTVLRVLDDIGSAEPYAALAFTPGVAAVADLGVVDGDLADLRGDAVAVGADAARLWGVGVGDRLDLVLADGTEAAPEITATYERGLGFGSIVLAADLLAGPRFYDAVLVAGDPAAVAGWASGVPGLTTAEGAAVPQAPTGMTPDQWISLMATLAMTGYVLLGTANGLVAATGRRRGEFAALRAVGATPRQVRAMVGREALVTAAIAVGAGLAFSVPPMAVLGLGFLGEPWPHGPWWVIPVTAGAAVLLAWAATAIPVRRALAGPPTAALAVD